MQAVIALCHFCENHGPRVVMTCQPMRDFDSIEEPTPSVSSLCPSTSTSPPGPVSSFSDIERSKDFIDSMRNSDYFDSSIPFHYGNCVRIAMDPEDRCKACSSFGNGPCLLSNDHPNKTSYISSEIALQERVYERVKNACLRSLSCELSSNPRRNQSATSSPALSGARTRSRNSETANHATPAMAIGGSGSGHRNVTQTNSSDLFDPELAGEENGGCVIFGDVDNGFCFSYTFRLPDAKARGFLRLFSLIAISNDLTILTNNFDYFKNALGELKNRLQQSATLTYEREIRSGEKYTEEDVMRPEYASMVGRMPRWFRRKIAIDTDRNLETITSDSTIWTLLHRHMMWTLRSLALTCRDQVMEGKPTQDMMVLMELDKSLIVQLELLHPNQHAVSMIQLSNLKWISNQLEMYAEPGDLDLFIRQIVTGGQIVIESAEKVLCSQLFLAVSNLLPIGCLRIANYRDHYLAEYSTSYNFIGGPVSMDVPLEVSDVMILSLVSNKQKGESDTLTDCTIQVLRRPEAEGTKQHPQIVKRYKELLLDAEVNDSVLETTLRTTREFWLSKAKICYQMNQQNNATSFYDIVQVIRNVSIEDRQVIIFWQAGLSSVYKNSVVSTIESRPHTT